jgi:hypothetical protein
MLRVREGVAGLPNGFESLQGHTFVQASDRHRSFGGRRDREPDRRGQRNRAYEARDVLNALDGFARRAKRSRG